MDELILTNISLFSGLSRLELAKIIPAFEKEIYEQEQLIFEEGSKGDSLFIIASGEVLISKKDNTISKEIARLKTTDCFGEMALFTGEKRSATAHASSKTTVFKLTKEKFDKLLVQNHFLSLYFNELLSKRLAQKNAQVDEYQERNLTMESDQIIDTEKPGKFKKLMQHKISIGIFFTLIVCTGIFFLLKQAEINHTHIIIIEIILVSTLLCAFRIISFMIASVSIPLACVLAGAATPQVVFSGYANSSWFFLIGFLALAAALTKSGLLFRMILKILLKFPASYYGQTLALLLSGLLLTPVLSSKNARIILISPIALDLCDALNLKNNTKGTVGIAMSIFFGYGQLSFAFMNGSAFNLMMYGLLPSDVAMHINWTFWFKAALVSTVVFIMLSYAAILFLFRPEKKLGLNRNIIRAQLITMGPISRQEKQVAGVVILTLFFLITQPFHGIDNAWIALITFIILITLNLLNEKAARADIDWSYLMAFGALMGVGRLIADSGLAAVIAKYLGQIPEIMFENKILLLIFLALIFYLIRFVLPNNSALLVFMLTFTPIVSAVGINPFVIGLIALLCLNPWFLFNQNIVFQSLLHGTEGRLFTHQQTLKLAFMYVLITLIVIGISYPYWNYLGLIK